MVEVPLGEWLWWVGRDDEVYTDQCGSREEALEVVTSDYDGVAYICEAIKRPLKLSDQFDAAMFIENADENVYDDCIGEYGDSVFEVTAEQGEDLEAMVRIIMDSWQTKHGLQFVPFMFSEMRNCEHIDTKPVLDGPPRPSSPPTHRMMG